MEYDLPVAGRPSRPPAVSLSRRTETGANGTARTLPRKGSTGRLHPRVPGAGSRPGA